MTPFGERMRELRRAKGVPTPTADVERCRTVDRLGTGRRGCRTSARRLTGSPALGRST